MKKFKKFTAIALAGVMAMSVLAGCGKGSETSGEKMHRAMEGVIRHRQAVRLNFGMTINSAMPSRPI